MSPFTSSIRTCRRPSAPLLARILFLTACAAIRLQGVPAEDGLYATFQISRNGASVGEFTARLDFEKAPRTAANFAGLAEGSRTWIDFQGGRAVRRPFYNGITFHRVVPGFVIQAGSPNGSGTDGPGYTFRDEFHSELRHDKAGILSMANSGPDSNGSQFFVTLAATPHLNDVHNVFGDVIEGMETVTSVQQGDVITSVLITRNGAAAEGFDASGPMLPAVLDGLPELHRTPQGFQLAHAGSDNSEVVAFHSADLGGWARLPGRLFYGEAQPQPARDVSSHAEGNPAGFFSVARVQYPDAIHTLSAIGGKRLTLTDAGQFELAFSISGESTGTYTYTSSGTFGPYLVNDYQWHPEAYRARWIADIYNAGGLSASGIPIAQAVIQFKFSSAAGGTYRGALYDVLNREFPVSGNFAVSELPPPPVSNTAKP